MMSRKHKLQVGLLAGAMAVGMGWGGLTAARAQEAQAQDAQGQQAAAQQDGDQQGRRGRGQGRGQGAGGFGARNPEQAVEQYREQVYALNLSDEQKTKLDPVFKEQAEKAKTLAGEVEGLQGRERAEKTMGFAREMRDKVQAQLTDEQRQTLRKNQSARLAKQMTERYRRATAELGLSEDQKTKVDAVLSETEKKYSEALAQVEPGQGGGQGGGGQFRELNQETREKINAVLTDEQKTKFEEASRQGRGGQGGGRRGGQGGNQQ